MIPKQFSLICAATLLAFVLAAPGALAQIDTEKFNALIDHYQELLDGGKYVEAEKAARQIHAINQRYFPEKFYGYSFIGLALMNQGKYEEARPLLETYLQHCRRAHGASHMTVEALSNLGALYNYMARLDEAQAALEEAVAMARQALGQDHSATLNSQTNLAFLMQNRGELTRSCPMIWEFQPGR